MPPSPSTPLHNYFFATHVDACPCIPSDACCAGASHHAQVLRAPKRHRRYHHHPFNNIKPLSMLLTQTSNAVAAAIADDYCASPTAGPLLAPKQIKNPLTQKCSQSCPSVLSSAPMDTVLSPLVHPTSPCSSPLPPPAAAISSSCATALLSWRNGNLSCKNFSRSVPHPRPQTQPYITAAPGFSAR